MARRSCGSTRLPGEQTFTIDWELDARPQSQGRGFTLGLPGDETTFLELDLPRGWVASSQRGIRRGPLAAADSARALWEIEGESGRFDIEVRDPQDPGQSIARSRAWVSGPTEIDLRRTSERAGELVNWTTEWRVEIDPRHPGRLEAELDPGLELIDVQGPAVRGYRIQRPGSAPRVMVVLDGGSPSAVIRFLAHASVPSEGAWRIPAMRPLDATWTGGRTTVILDELHVVRQCREEAGRLVVPRRGDPNGANRLTFEADSPRSVAELVFLGPRVDLTCTTRGQLFITNASPRIECRLDWALHRGSAPELEVDLSPAWIPEQVRIEGLDDPVAWHPSLLSSGATRLHVMVPATVLARKTWALLIGASSTVPGGRGPLELPRVRAVGAAIGDEAWLAWADDDTVVRPTRAAGLAWIDPAEGTGLPSRAAAAGLREALAWRWTSPTAEGRVRPQTDRPEPHRLDPLPSPDQPGPAYALPRWHAPAPIGHCAPGLPAALDRSAGGPPRVVAVPRRGWYRVDLAADRRTGSRSPRVSPQGIGPRLARQPASPDGESHSFRGVLTMGPARSDSAPLGPPCRLPVRYHAGRDPGRDALPGRDRGSRPLEPLRGRPFEDRAGAR